MNLYKVNVFRICEEGVYMKIQEILYNELSNEESVKEQMIEITENNHTQKVKKSKSTKKKKWFLKKPL